jgi:hypothetical protein
MAAQHAYAVTNSAGSLGASAFVWSNAAATNRTYLNDGRMDQRFSVGSVATTVNVVIDFGAAVSLTAIALLNSNIASATAPTIAIAAATDSGITTSVVNPKSATTPNTTAPQHKDHVLQFTAVSKRYWRITWAWTGSFTVQLGEIFACTTVPLTRYTTFGHGERQEIIRTQFDGSLGESRGHFLGGPYRKKTLPFADLSATERTELLTMHSACYGGASPMLWCHLYETGSTAAPAAYQDCIFGRLEDAETGWDESDFQRYEPDSFAIRSLAREFGS